jgi:hypothetical protein
MERPMQLLALICVPLVPVAMLPILQRLEAGLDGRRHAHRSG